MTKHKNKTIAERIAGFVTRKPFVSLALALLLIVAMVPGLKKLQADFSYRIWFSESDPLLKAYDAFERRFGNDETVAVIVHSPSGIFDPESTELVQQLTAELWQVPEIIRVDSLSNYNWTHADGDDIMVEPLLPDDEELTADMLKKRKKIALEHEVIPGYLVSKDGKTAVVYASIKPSFEGSPNYNLIINGGLVGNVKKEGVKDKIDKFKNRGDHSFYLTGSGAISDAFREASQHDLSNLVPILLAVIIFFILVLLRRFSALVLSFIVIILSMIFTFGFAGLVGIKFNNVIATLPNTLIAISIADAIHIIVNFFQYRRSGIQHKDAVFKSLSKNLQPTFLTSFSTSIGFFSFFSAKVLPISSMGFLASVGVMGAWVITIFIVGPLLTVLPIKVKVVKKADHEVKEEITEPKPWAWAVSNWILKYRAAIISIFVVLTIASAFIGLRNEVNSDPFKYFPEGFYLRTANDFMNDHVGGAAGLELAIDSGESNGIKDPAFLKKVQEYQEWLNRFPKVTNTISIIDILKQTNRSLHGDDQKYYRIPETKAAVAQQLFLYTMSLPQGMDLNDRITIDNDALRLTVRWTMFKSKEATRAFEQIKNKGAELGLNVNLTGKTPMYQSMNGYVVSSFITSLAFALFFIGLMMVITFRSIKTGLMSLIPNVIPLFFGTALMTILSKPLDIGTVVVTSICLGIAVDDTIHFLTNFYNWRRAGYNAVKATAMVFSYTGPALVVTTLILVAGFGTFAFAFFVPNINFGILTALILSTALLTDLILLPAIVMLKVKQEDIVNTSWNLFINKEAVPVRVNTSDKR
jgi:predicted RND superfamily exporter protein